MACSKRLRFPHAFSSRLPGETLSLQGVTIFVRLSDSSPLQSSTSQVAIQLSIYDKGFRRVAEAWRRGLEEGTFNKAFPGRGSQELWVLFPD